MIPSHLALSSIVIVLVLVFPALFSFATIKDSRARTSTITSTIEEWRRADSPPPSRLLFNRYRARARARFSGSLSSLPPSKTQDEDEHD